jgi:hypothetical protein
MLGRRIDGLGARRGSLSREGFTSGPNGHSRSEKRFWKQAEVELKKTLDGVIVNGRLSDLRRRRALLSPTIIISREWIGDQVCRVGRF